jgi:hypothetical protein
MQCQNSAGQMVDLCANGSKVIVNYSNLDEYIEGCVNVRLTESKE